LKATIEGPGRMTQEAEQGNKNEWNTEEGNTNFIMQVHYKGCGKRIPIVVMDVQISDVLSSVYLLERIIECEFISWVLSSQCLKIIEWEGREEGRKKKKKRNSQNLMKSERT
jgi:hypothetical protein